MNYEQLVQLATEAGFTAWGPLDVSTIELKQQVRDMCAVNTCGKYEKCWSCPPGCGSIEECEERISGYTHGILVQTYGDIEDGFDFEAIMEIEEAHKEHFQQMYAKLREQKADTLAIGAGACTVCKTCTYPDAPCRFPERMVSSMEAYGMLVLEVCKKNDLTYYYGPDKMAYTSCFLLK